MKTAPKLQRGFSLIELLIVVAIIGIIAAIAVPYLNSARQATQSASAVSSLRTINSAQNAYRQATGQYGTLVQLGSGGYIADQNLANGQKSQYNFAVANNTDLNYEANADPLVDTNNSFQHYYIDASGVIRINVGAVASAASTPIQ